MTIPEGTGLVFTWSGPVRHNIIEMASSDQSPNDCRFAGGNSGPLGQVGTYLQLYVRTCTSIWVVGLFSEIGTPRIILSLFKTVH